MVNQGDHDGNGMTGEEKQGLMGFDWNSVRKFFPELTGLNPNNMGFGD